MITGADLGSHSEALTAFAVELGEGASLVVDQVAVPFGVDTMEYSIPKYGFTTLASSGKTQTAVESTGELPVATSGAPTFVSGACIRRGQKRAINLELKKKPNGNLFADEEVETKRILFDLMLEMELRLKTLLDAYVGVSGRYVTLSATDQFNYTTADPKMIRTLETAMRAVELGSGKSLDDPGWRMIIPPFVADAMKEYLRTKLLYTDKDFQVGGLLPQRVAGVIPILAGAMQDTAKAGQTPSVARIWTDDRIYLVYVDPSFAQSPRTFTALAQPRWTGRPTMTGEVTSSYSVATWRDPRQDVLLNWVAADIYDNLELISAEGIYVINDVLG